MTLQQEIQSIVNDASLGYDAKAEKLLRIITKQELSAVLPKPVETITLKEPLKPKTTGMKTLMLSIHKVYLDAILAGTKKIEYRDWANEYYQRKCSYEEDGKRYLRPYDALVLYVGRGKSALTATVALTDITCDGTYLMFHLGKILYTNSQQKY